MYHISMFIYFGVDMWHLALCTGGGTHVFAALSVCQWVSPPLFFSVLFSPPHFSPPQILNNVSEGNLCPYTSTHYTRPGTKYLVPDTWYQVFGTWHILNKRAFGAKCLIPNTWYQVCGAKYLVPGT